MRYGPVGIQGEGDVGVGSQLAVAPASYEGVVLPVHQVTDERRGMSEADDEAVVVALNVYLAIPGVGVLARVALERE